MTKYTLSTVVFCVCAVGLSHGWLDKLPIPIRPNGCKILLNELEIKRCYPCNSFRTKTVTLVVRNILREPTFEQSVTLKCTRSRTLFYMMQEAADIDTTFRFTATYFDSQLGFFIEAINSLAGNFSLDQTFWEILDGNDQQTPVGASSYEPSNGETVTFNFTQSSGHN